MLQALGWPPPRRTSAGATTRGPGASQTSRRAGSPLATAADLPLATTAGIARTEQGEPSRRRIAVTLAPGPEFCLGPALASASSGGRRRQRRCIHTHCSGRRRTCVLDGCRHQRGRRRRVGGQVERRRGARCAAVALALDEDGHGGELAAHAICAAPTGVQATRPKNGTKTPSTLVSWSMSMPSASPSRMARSSSRAAPPRRARWCACRSARAARRQPGRARPRAPRGHRGEGHRRAGDRRRHQLPVAAVAGEQQDAAARRRAGLERSQPSTAHAPPQLGASSPSMCRHSRSMLPKWTKEARPSRRRSARDELGEGDCEVRQRALAARAAAAASRPGPPARRAAARRASRAAAAPREARRLRGAPAGRAAPPAGAPPASGHAASFRRDLSARGEREHSKHFQPPEIVQVPRPPRAARRRRRRGAR